MHFVKCRKILNSKNGLNIYRGCTHGCIYCDSRSTCYQINHEFTDIEVKENACELLDLELSKKRKKVIVGTGSMSDPYNHYEKNLCLTRKMLEVIDKNKCGVHLLTKSAMVLRDIDILKRINEHSKTIIALTLTTYDEKLQKIIEPNVSTTKERFEALKVLHENGIETGVWLGPILPYINDSYENMTEILRMCVDAKVKYIMCFGIGLTLRSGNREYFYDALDKNFKGLKEKYINEFHDSYEVSSPNFNKLWSLFIGITKKYNIMNNTNEIFKYISKYESHESEYNLFTIEGV